jgi:hypothetical protein
MKARNLHNITSEPAPRECRELPEIKAQYPTQRNVEKSLQKLVGMNICIWMIGYGGVWKPASDFFHVK